MDKTDINMNYKIVCEISCEPPKKHVASLNDINYEDILIRFYDIEDYAKDFINQGKLFMRSLESARRIESVRSDPNEGLARNTLIDRSKYISFPDKIKGLIPIPDIIPIDIEPKCKNIFIFCMSYLKLRTRNTLRIENLKKYLKDNYRVQRYAIIITDIIAYLNRLKEGIKSTFSSDQFSLGLVNYKERTPFDYLGFQDGDLFFRSLCFQKDISFSDEHEFRAAVIDKSKNDESYFINIGNCEDIAVLIDLEE